MKLEIKQSVEGLGDPAEDINNPAEDLKKALEVEPVSQVEHFTWRSTLGDPPIGLTDEEAVAHLAQKPCFAGLVRDAQWIMFREKTEPILAELIKTHQGYSAFLERYVDKLKGIILKKTLDNRDAFVVEMLAKGIPKDTPLEKEGYAENGQPKTRISVVHRIADVEGIPVRLVLNYSRDGLPTAKCRMTASTYFSVVCDINPAG